MAEEVLVVIGIGGMGQAIARRLGSGKRVVLADFDETALRTVAETMRADGYAVTSVHVDVSVRESVLARAATAAALGS
ncbi:saccharopine dehydrogenase NADP-binding domain-containing protein, partial [Nocardia salmonicida]